MSYNRGYDIPMKSYNKENGCIDFPKEQWKSWFDLVIKPFYKIASVENLMII